MTRDDNGWEASAAAWIVDMAERGGFAREHVIDAPLLARIEAGKFTRAVGIGCGEGRLRPAMQAMGIAAVGVEPRRGPSGLVGEGSPSATGTGPLVSI